MASETAAVRAGQAGDSPHLPPALDAIAVPRHGRGRVRKRPAQKLDDKACSSRANRAWLHRHGIAATIPSPADHARHRGRAGGQPLASDPVVYRDRNAVERGIHQLRQHRAVATRYDKLAVRDLACVHIAAIDQGPHDE
ncbi:transposase [Nocardia asteroides]|nr:transposase [Nocardia asteroides]UGT65118.1 transposase [Nocardia asteroides]